MCNIIKSHMIPSSLQQTNQAFAMSLKTYHNFNAQISHRWRWQLKRHPLIAKQIFWIVTNFSTMYQKRCEPHIEHNCAAKFHFMKWVVLA